MSVKNVVSNSEIVKEGLGKINFLAFSSNAEVIAKEGLKECAKSKLESVKERIDQLNEAVEKSNFLSDKWLKNHVVKTIRLIPKQIPPEVGGYDDDDAQLFGEIFMEVRGSLKSIRDALDEQLQKELVEESSLLAEQEDLHEDEAFINRLKTFPQTLNKTPPKVYMAYAWPLDKIKIGRREKKVQLFLQKLETHLTHLGVITKLDVKDCSKGSSIYEYMKKEIEKSDNFLLFGTESLLRKMEAYGGIPLRDHHAGGYPLICYELGQAYKKATKAKTQKEKLDRPVILPVLLTGNMNKSFPEHFQGNRNVVLFPEVGYLEGLKRIVYVLYAFQKLGTRKPIFDQDWKNWFEKERVPTEKSESDQCEILHRLEEKNQKIKELSASISDFKSKSLRDGDRVKEIEQKLDLSEKNVFALDKELQQANKELCLLKEKVSSQRVIIERLQKESATIPKIAFGKADWEKYFGEVEEEPPLPANIEEILKSACPFWPDKRVEETHLLMLVPKTVDGVPLTLNSLSELIKVPKQGNATEFRHYENVRKEYGNKPITSSHWVLLTKDVILNSRNKSYENQRKLIAGNGEYEVPQLMDVVVGIMMHHAKTGERLYSDKPYIYTRCKEALKNGRQTVVGGFSPGGLNIFSRYSYDNDIVGVGGSRKF